ncbi:MAG: hypothetical protein IPM23_18290 [Candidatus Melainabacteria bacterium]|nr:hypothetical protein [Candidatus Melainabacteria bacterium]
MDNDAPCFERSERFSYILAVDLIALLIEELSSSLLPVWSWSVLDIFDVRQGCSEGGLLCDTE